MKFLEQRLIKPITLLTEVKDNNPNLTVILGKSSANDYLRQLIAAGCIDSEMSFYARIKDRCKPDTRLGIHAMDKGECGFSYIIGPVSNSDPPQPLLVTPLVPGTDRFDPQPFAGKAVILWTDNNVTTPPIGKDGKIIHLGVNLLDPANPVWRGKPLKITWPE